MTILSGKTIRRLGIITPHVDRCVAHGMTYGESLAGYDIRLGETAWFNKDGFSLAVSKERFKLPKNVIGIVHDKSSWARKGLSVQNTVLEPGWEGYLTLELNLNSNDFFCQHISADTLYNIAEGMPIAQVVFHYVDEETDGYNGKYQNQPGRPVEAIHEG